MCLRWDCLVAFSRSPLCNDNNEMNVPKRYVILESNSLKYFIVSGGGICNECEVLYAHAVGWSYRYYRTIWGGIYRWFEDVIGDWRILLKRSCRLRAAFVCVQDTNRLRAVREHVHEQLKNERPTWCHLLFCFTSYVLSMFRTLIYPSSGACDCVVELPHRSSCSQFVVCWRFGVAGFEWCSFCRLRARRPM